MSLVHSVDLRIFLYFDDILKFNENQVLLIYIKKVKCKKIKINLKILK